MRRWVPLIAALVALTAPTGVAHAVVPEDAVAGAGKYWFWGTNVQQWGTNCQILGQASPEPMVSSTSFYGGLGGVPAVTEKYWIGVLVSIPGVPCGTGIAGVVTDLVLPPSTTLDVSRRIRCFGTRRFESDFREITDETYDFAGSTYEYCPDAATVSQYSGAISFGSRLLANGQMFEIFIPVTTSAAIGGGDRAKWLISGTGVYSDEQPGVTQVAMAVVPKAGTSPYFFFSRPAATPYWDKAASPGTENRVELFMSVYTAGRAGKLTFELLNAAGDVVDNSTNPALRWGPDIPAGDNVRILSPAADFKGPNGGFVPWAFTPNGATYRVRWKFVSTSPSGTYYGLTDPFRVLPGPDNDGDGVADVEDACPTTRGSDAKGCPPALPVEPSAPTGPADDDGDGIANGADACPTAAGGGQASGCPAPTGRTTASKRISRKEALAGVPVSFTCDIDAKVQIRLMVDKANQAKLGLTPTKKPIAVAATTTTCKAGKKGGKATLKITKRYARNVAASKGRATATLEIVMTGAGNAARTTTQKTTVT